MSPAYEPILGSLLNEIFAAEEELLLVIDDYHLVQSKEVHALVLFFIEHLPARLHLFIATRSDWPFMLARLCSQNQRVDVRAGELAFRLDTSKKYFSTRILWLPGRKPRADCRRLPRGTAEWQGTSGSAVIEDPSEQHRNRGGASHFLKYLQNPYQEHLRQIES